MLTTFISTINSHRATLALATSQGQSFERLSTGKRINRSSDDAAGLAISEKMRSQIRGLAQATRNSQDGISLIQTAEGALEEIHRILERARKLTAQASNGTYTLTDRENIKVEINQIMDEVNQISRNTEFNTKRLLSGDTRSITETIYITDNENRLPVTQEDIDEAYQYFLDNISLRTAFFTDMEWLLHIKTRAFHEAGLPHLGGVNNNIPWFSFDVAIYHSILAEEFQRKVINTLPGATFSNEINSWMIDQIGSPLVFEMSGGAGDPALDYRERLYNQFFQVGVINTWANRLSNDLQNSNFFEFDPSLVQGRPITTTETRTINFSTPLQLQVQSGANAGQRTDINIRNMSLQGLGLSNFTDRFSYYINSSEKEPLYPQDPIYKDGEYIYTPWFSPNLSGRRLSSLLDTLDKAINTVSRQRAELGAIQNRLEHTINNLQVVNENMEASDSRIRDADMAREMMKLAKSNILQQTSISMIAQGNQLQHDIIQLLL